MRDNGAKAEYRYCASRRRCRERRLHRTSASTSSRRRAVPSESPLIAAAGAHYRMRAACAANRPKFTRRSALVLQTVIEASGGH